MQATTSPPPPVEHQYRYSLYSGVDRTRKHPPSARIAGEAVPQPWLVFEAKDEDGRRVLWEKWLEIREKWAGDSARWK